MISEDTLREIFANGETLSVEFKSDRDSRDKGYLKDDKLAEAVVGLANTEGGKLIIGVEDDGTVTGLHQRRSGSEPHVFSGIVSNKTVPPISVKVESIDLPEGRIALINVLQGSQIASTANGRSLIRYLDSHGKPQQRAIFPTEIDSWHSHRGQLDVTAREMTNSKWEDLDPIEFDRLRRLLTEYKNNDTLKNLSNRELAKALNFIKGDDGTPTLAGLLIVGKEEVLRELIPNHEVAFQTLQGQDVVKNEFYRWPLLRIFERVMEALSVRNEESELTVDLFRVGIPAYDSRAFREAFNNAVTHRDYSRTGAVHLQIYDDAIKISNPGGFMEGIRLDNLLNSGPLPRNPLLADIFQRLGLVERTGRGIGLIYSGQLRTGRLPPDYSQSTETSVVVRLPGGKADLDFVRIIKTEEKRLNKSFTVDELLLLSVLRRERQIEDTEIAKIIQKNKNDADRILEGLIEDGLIEKSKNNKREYILSASIYRQMGKPEAYTRRQGFERLQWEFMIVQYVTQHEQIKRVDVEQLCKITSHQARALVRKLLEKGILEKIGTGGTGRGTYYVLAGTASSQKRAEKKPVISKQEPSRKTETKVDIKPIQLTLDLEGTTEKNH